MIIRAVIGVAFFFGLIIGHQLDPGRKCMAVPWLAFMDRPISILAAMQGGCMAGCLNTDIVLLVAAVEFLVLTWMS